MIFGMTFYTFVHVLISLIGIISGLIVLAGLLASDRKDGWTLIFLVSTAATSLTGFGFPYQGFTPAIGVGILSIIILIVAIAARYPLHLAGPCGVPRRWLPRTPPEDCICLPKRRHCRGSGDSAAVLRGQRRGTPHGTAREMHALRS